MRKFLSVTLLVFLAGCLSTVSAERHQVDIEDLRFVLDSSTKKASVQKFIGPTSRKTVTIPDNIMMADDGITYKVTEIGSLAFYKSNVVTVNFPSTIKTIGACAFQECPRFSKGKALELPPNLTSIGMEAFRGCHFTEVRIPSKVTSIGESAFAYSDIKTLRFDALSGSLTIDNFAFRSCKSLTAVALPAKLKSMGQAVFGDCTALTSVSFPSSLTKIPSLGFQDCTALASVSLPSGVTTIEWGAFQGSGIKTISLPGTLKKIGQQAFSNSGLTSIVIPASVTNIPWMCFSGCLSLTSVSLPATLKSIESGAFWECDALRTIRCDAVTPPDAADEAVFSKPCYTYATLQLPAASVSAYSCANVWQNFAWFVTSGVDSVEDNESAPAEYFTLSGMRLDGKPSVPGMYVVRRGSAASVVNIR